MTLDRLRDEVNKEFNVDIMLKKRRRHLVYSRRVFIALALEISNSNTYESIGEYLGLDRVTVYYNHKSFNNVYQRHKLGYNSIIFNNNLDIELLDLKTKDKPKGTEEIIDEIKYLLHPLDISDLINFRDSRLIPYLRMI